MKTAFVVTILGCATGTTDTDTFRETDSDGDADTDSGTGTGTGTGTEADAGADTDSDGADTDSAPATDEDLPIEPGATGVTPMGVEIYVPTSYPAAFSSPVLWLWNERFDDWRAIADAETIVLVDVTGWVGDDALADALNESEAFLLEAFDVDIDRYYWAGWSGGGNAVVTNGSINQEFLAGVMVFPGTGGDYAAGNLESWDGHQIRFFYACGTADDIYPADGVEAEADAWTAWGYETRFERVEGAGHYIDEATYGIRATAWAWIEGFTRRN